MSYAPYLRNTSGIVFFGEQGNQPTFYSDSNFLIEDGAAGHIQAPNLIISDGGNIGSVSDPDSISIASNGNVSLTQSLSVGGDLTVNGTTTTVNSTIVTIEDPVVIIGSQAGDNPYGSTADDNKDRGIAYYWNDGGPKIGFFGHDDSIRGFTYIPSGTFDAASGVITGPVGWATFAGVSGEIAGSFQNARYIGASGHAVGSGLFDGSADQVPNIELTTVAIVGQTAEATPDNDDLILIYDNSAGALRKQTRAQFVSGLGAGSMDSFNVTGDTGTPETINDGNTLTITGGSGIATRITATDTLTVNVKVDASTIAIVGDELEVADNGITATQLNTSVAGAGLSGGGGTALAIDISEFSVGVMNSGDSFLVLGNDGATEERITISQLGSWLAGTNITVSGDGRLSAQGNFSSFDITGDTGTETVNDGETVTFAGSTGLDAAVTATNTVTYTIDISEYSTAAVAVNDSFLMLDSDGTTEQRSTVTQLGAYMAGTNITNTNGVLSVPDSTIDGVIFETANFVDSSTVDFTVTAGTSVTAIVPDDAITEAKLSRVVVTDTTTSTMADTEDVSLVNAAGGAVVLTLPAVTNSGRIVRVKKTDATANTVTVQRGGSSTIDGATTKILYSQYESITMVSDGTNWHIV